jgi:putative DNA primase/helicase
VSLCVRGHVVETPGRCDVCDYRQADLSSSSATAAGDGADGRRAFPRTDAGNAELLTALYGDRVRYDHRRRRWLSWQGEWWAPDVDSEVVRLAKETARRRYLDAASIDNLKEREAEANWAIASENRFRLEAALNLAKAELPIADAGDRWDADGSLLGVANGVIDLRTGQLRPGRRDDRITMHTAVPFYPDAECPRWETFLLEIFGGDEELVDYVWRAMGYSLTGDTSEQCHFICWGSGWNGKTTFQRVQREVMGDYSANTPFATLEMSSRYAIPNDLAALVGKRLVTASELNEAVRLNEARLKMLAGEDPVTARFLHGEFFTFLPVAKFWLSVNHKPFVNDDSTGFWRKVRLIPFTQSFEGRAGKDLKDVLRSEYQGVLAWTVRGCLEWRKRGLGPPEVVRTATLAYRAESDPLAVFLRERCVVGAGFTAKASALYREYLAWSEDAGLKERERLSNTRFGRLMAERFKRREQSSGNFYEGIGLRGAERRTAEAAVEGSLSGDPPLPDSPLGGGAIGENGNNPPRPSTRYGRLSGDPPQDPPAALHDPPARKPTKPCRNCDRDAWWLRPDGEWVCGVCHPASEIRGRARQ